MNLLRVERVLFIIWLHDAELSSSSPAPVTSGLLGLCIILRTLLSNTLHLCSSLNVRKPSFRSIQNTDKIVILYESKLSA